MVKLEKVVQYVLKVFIINQDAMLLDAQEIPVSKFFVLIVIP